MKKVVLELDDKINVILATFLVRDNTGYTIASHNIDLSKSENVKIKSKIEGVIGKDAKVEFETIDT